MAEVPTGHERSYFVEKAVKDSLRSKKRRVQHLRRALYYKYMHILKKMNISINLLRLLSTFNMSENQIEPFGRHLVYKSIPDSLDLRETGFVGRVHNQGRCNSCWAFSAVETIESALAITTGEAPVSLSVEQILVCCKTVVTQ